jgi:tryptophan 7-halogenase
MESDRRIRRIAILGGGTAAWMSAVVMARKLGTQCSIQVVDVPEGQIMGEGAGVLPPFLDFLRFAGIDQNDFIDKTQATYSLGTRYFDWREAGQSFWHPHGAFGPIIERRPFYHFWHKARAQGLNPRPEFFSLEIAMAEAGRFIFPTNALGVAQSLRYGLHCDTTLATRYLRGTAERLGVTRLDRRPTGVTRREDGGVAELKFEEGASLAADLYLDCTEDGRLIGSELGVPFADWSEFLPCDRTVVVASAIDAPRAANVRVTARAAGWQQQVALQHLVANSYCYSSAHLSDEAAREELLAAVGEVLGEPQLRQAKHGARAECWKANVVAIGPAAGSVDALASTSLQLIINALFNLLDRFPGSAFDAANTRAFNDLVGHEYERMRDFALAHYVLSAREDSGFWQSRRAVPLPASLAERIALYRGTGRVQQQRYETFTDLDWFYVLDGMGIVPRDYDPLVDLIDFEQVKRVMLACHQKVMNDTSAAPSHDSFFAAANARLGGTPGRARVAGAGTAS